MIELRPHQQKAVDEMHNGCILCGGVGSGKTITSLVYFWTKVCGGVVGDLGSLRTPTDLYVITTAKKRDSLDWEKECAKLGLSDERLASVEALKVTVDSWNNIGKYVGVRDAFFVFDEQKVVGSGAWVKSFYDITKANKWVILSATPGDTWLDYIPVFVANGFYRNRTEFKRIHVVYTTYTKFPKVDRYIGVNHLVKLRNQILVDMPYEKHTVRRPVEVDVDYDRELYDKVVKKRWHVYEERPIRDVAELFAVMRRVVNSDNSRLIHVRTLLKEHRRLIVFYNFNYELEMLRTLVPPDQLASPESIRDLKEKIDTTEIRNRQTSTLKSTTPGSSAIMRLQEDEWICGFQFRGQLCEERLPCARHEGLSPGMLITRKDKACLTTSKSTEPPWETCSPTCQSCSAKESLNVEDSSNVCIQTNASMDFSVAEWNGHKHEKIPQTDSWLYLVNYKAGAEGWNCIETDAMAFYSLTYSYKDFAQAHGRIDRLNTPFVDLYYYIFKSKAAIDKAVWRALSTKKSFNERKYSAKMG